MPQCLAGTVQSTRTYHPAMLKARLVGKNVLWLKMKGTQVRDEDWKLLIPEQLARVTLAYIAKERADSSEGQTELLTKLCCRSLEPAGDDRGT